MARSNSVFGPARAPIFDVPGKKDSGKRTIYLPGVATGLREVVWSIPGAITPEAFADAAASPGWSPYQEMRIIDCGLVFGSRYDQLIQPVEELTGAQYFRISCGYHGRADSSFLGSVFWGSVTIDTSNQDNFLIRGDGPPDSPLDVVSGDVNFSVWGTTSGIADGVVFAWGLTFIMWYTYT